MGPRHGRVLSQAAWFQWPLVGKPAIQVCSRSTLQAHQTSCSGVGTSQQRTHPRQDDRNTTDTRAKHGLERCAGRESVACYRYPLCTGTGNRSVHILPMAPVTDQYSFSNARSCHWGARHWGAHSTWKLQARVALGPRGRTWKLQDRAALGPRGRGRHGTEGRGHTPDSRSRPTYVTGAPQRRGTQRNKCAGRR